jgi:hypothetical protein
MTDIPRDAISLVAAPLWAGAVVVVAGWTYPMFKAAILDDCSRPADKKWGMPWEQGRESSESACAHTQPHRLPRSRSAKVNPNDGNIGTFILQV